MDTYKVKRYQSKYKSVWDKFVEASKNSTFLFNRDFMEYHQDRFEDYSLLVFKNDNLIALLPANIVDSDIYSHQGLSYGGLLILNSIRIEEFVNSFKTLLKFLTDQGINKLTIKQIPFIYHSNLSGEFDYLLDSLAAKTVYNDSYFVIDDLKHYKVNRNRKRALVKAKENQVVLSNQGIEYFWESILTKNLESKFNTKPVHSIDEINFLISNFPDHIKFYSAKTQDDIKAGAVVFLTDNVAHIQYSSGASDRDETAALDFLFHQIIKAYKKKSYVSFGSSSTDSTLKIDRGLAYWKESYGAKTIAQKHFEIDTENWYLLNSIFK